MNERKCEIQKEGKYEKIKLWGFKMEKVMREWAMVGGRKRKWRRKKKHQDEDVRINQPAVLQAPVIASVITSQCVEHRLFFDPFVMISIQSVRTPRIQNGFCRISRYCVTVSLAKHSLESCISSFLPHMCVCVTVSTRAAHCFLKGPVCVCNSGVCVMGESGV